jgi:hypothetical protein
MPYSATVNGQAYRIDSGENSQQREVTIEGTPCEQEPVSQSGRCLGGD